MSKDEKNLQIRNSTAEFLIFTGQAGEKSIEARYEDETIWLTQKLMATLFEVTSALISEHLKNIFPAANRWRIQLSGNSGITAADGKALPDQPLQSRRHHFGGLPGEFNTGNPVPAVGHPCSAGIRHQGFRVG